MNRFVSLIAQKEIRDGRRYKQKEIAELADVSESTVSRWVNGVDFEKSSLETVRRLCIWLECEIGDLVFIERAG